MKKLFAILIMFIVIPVAAKETTMTPEIINSLHRLSDPQISPDGKWILYRVSVPNIKDNSFQSYIKLVSIDGKQNQTLIGGDFSVSNARWYPDGSKIGLITNKDETSQVYEMNLETKQLSKLTSMPNGVSNFMWSPNGKYISFTSAVKVKQTHIDFYPDLPKAEARIYDDLPVRHWDHWLDENKSHLFIMKLEGRMPIDIMQGEPYDTPDGPFGGVEDIAWSPDSKEIAYTSKKVQDYEISTNTDIFVYDIKNGLTKNITKGMNGFDKHPSFSPDGKYIAFTSMERAGFEADKIRLMLFDRKTFKINELTRTLDQWVNNYIWSPSSKNLYFSSGKNGTVQIYEINTAGSYKQLTTGTFNFDAGLEITPDGMTLVLGRRHMTRPTEFHTWGVKNARSIQLTDDNADFYKNMKLVDIKERWITSTDQKKVHAWIIYPPDFDPQKKYPMITYCQGGPQSMIGHYFSFRWNFFLMASQGYVVLAPNRRGMPGFGQEWNDAISGDWGGMPMTDILVATDEMLKEPYIDKNRIAAVGASAGGYAAFWLAGNHKGRFSALISHCGVFNFESMYGSTEEIWFPDWEYGGPYWDSKFKAEYDKNSPHRYAQNWDTPILITTGEYDFRVPYTQSLEAFTVAQLKGIPSKLITFPKENHWVLKPQNSILWNREFYGFLDKYCKNK